MGSEYLISQMGVSMPGSPKKFWKKFHEANVKQLSYQFEAFFKQLDQQVESKVSKKKKCIKRSG